MYVHFSAPYSSRKLIFLKEDIQEDWGWKLVHGEVFRTPQNPMVLAVMVGNGAQLSAMIGVTLGNHNHISVISFKLIASK